MTGTYRVKTSEYPSLAALVTDAMGGICMRAVCGISFLRFYTCRHGARMPKEDGHEELRTTAHLHHRHLDVIQIHRADTLMTRNGDAILVDLSDTKILNEDGVHLSQSGLKRYRVGFTTAYGYFRHYLAPRSNGCLTTFQQAYNSAAKMALPDAMGLVALYTMSRGFASVGRAASTRFERLRPKRASTFTRCSVTPSTT